MDQAHPVEPGSHTSEAAYRWLVRELRRIQMEIRRQRIQVEKRWP